MGGSKVEAGVEDRAALPAIIEFMKSHSQTLVMQEMIFGHSPKWTAKTGKSQLEYYDDYLLEVLRGLEQQNLADRTAGGALGSWRPSGLVRRGELPCAVVDLGTRRYAVS